MWWAVMLNGGSWDGGARLLWCYSTSLWLPNLKENTMLTVSPVSRIPSSSASSFTHHQQPIDPSGRLPQRIISGAESTLGSCLGRQPAEKILCRIHILDATV